VTPPAQFGMPASSVTMLVRATPPVFVIETRQNTVWPLGTATVEAQSGSFSQ
jgi:hypothetical protein